ncbi:hypothetical protein C0Q70_07414 [Pomacea canaliculata]|uniref:Uncharacterized protein n=1 Tax=Pomacea canaliculata TaxID=400727 RepID=A0A2T7PEZ5_POMCA|nr:hypothetical protein C0Q70_07414 [Pomacea canaliculata]
MINIVTQRKCNLFGVDERDIGLILLPLTSRVTLQAIGSNILRRLHLFTQCPDPLTELILYATSGYQQSACGVVTICCTLGQSQPRQLVIVLRALRMGHKKALVVYLVLCCATVLTILLSVWTTTGMFFTVHRSEEQTINPVGDPFVCLPVRRHPWHGKVQPEVPGLFINSTVYSSWTKEGNAMDVVGHLHSKMCPESSALPKVPLTFPDILLIVDFNSPNLYRVIPYLELLYRRHFADILYCGDDPETLKDIIVQKNITFPVYFLYIPDYAWQMKYRCLEYAMKMCGDYKGYLLIGDDTLVNVKTLKALGKDRVLVGKDFLRWVVNTTHFNEDWMWWELEGGRNAMLGVLNELVHRHIGLHDLYTQVFAVTRSARAPRPVRNVVTYPHNSHQPTYTVSPDRDRLQRRLMRKHNGYDFLFLATDHGES